MATKPAVKALDPQERLFYRNRLREARYAALADAEGFDAICFALEALGLRLHGEQAAMGGYEENIAPLATRSLVLTAVSSAFPSRFKSFAALYSIVRRARNDSMHTGAYARHATQAAIELSIGLEEALMAGVAQTVENLMVSSPVTVEPWQPVAHARQLMLMHSFSFLPVRLGGAWGLISELGLAKYLSNGPRKTSLMCHTIEEARGKGMEVVLLKDTDLLKVGMKVAEVLKTSKVQAGPMLWLVVDSQRNDHLAGVLSPFELM